MSARATWKSPASPVIGVGISYGASQGAIPLTSRFDTAPSGVLFVTLCPGEYLTCGSAGTRYFVATQGPYSVTRADLNTSTGFLRGSIGSTRVEEWSATSLSLIPGGDCFSLPSLNFEAHWP